MQNEIQSLLLNSACVRLSTKKLALNPAGGSISFTDFFSDLPPKDWVGCKFAEIDAKGRRGRDVGNSVALGFIAILSLEEEDFKEDASGDDTAGV